MANNKFDKIRILAKKKYLVDLIGGECSNCGEKILCTLDFHHLDPTKKDRSINSMRDFRLDVMEREVSKCILLCSNCHREHHSTERGGDSNSSLSQKIKLLEKLSVKCCSRCGYSKYIGALDFHHTDEKSFNIGSRDFNEFDEIPEYIVDEVNKCDVLCSNCHRKEHYYKFELDNFESILAKSRILIRSVSLDVNAVIDHYLNGISITEIALKFNTYKSTVSMLLKRHNVRKKRLKIDTDLVKSLRIQGKSVTKISEITGYGRTSIYSALES